MKKCFFIFLLVFLYIFTCVSLSAQKNVKSSIVKSWNRFQAGVELGPALTSVWGNDNYMYQSDVQYSSGIFFRYNFLKWMAIQSGINIEKVGTKLNDAYIDIQGNTIPDSYLKKQYDYLSFPIIFRFTIINRRINLNFSLGGFVSYMFDAKSISSPLPPGTPNDPNPGKEFVSDIAVTVKKHNAGLIGGIGVDYQIIKGFNIGIEVRDQLGLVDISNTFSQHTPPHTNSLQLLGRVSYKF